ncbi:magnetosome protein Mad30 [Fundidesulfovibrio magnetotacticus]|uniref:Magnetosome protein Mad30 n=1 Tax=Fundidesulfovibrio magnetotacticus TaxID=2730080 RepID=A0A6V8LKU6_9BACT|nr:metal-dependent transcriptional regulator [Fundidesulfovibrio magnetotacticus]GFK92304.1 magnetosome protein Mad30 [Fundidesulfovibrio magnetotacticus]
MHAQDECLEKLWIMCEKGEDDLDTFVRMMGSDYIEGMLSDLQAAGLASITQSGRRISLTKSGSERAKHIIRAHRIGERLLYDVFGGNFEDGACEFEHTHSTELVDGLCTLLGHPTKCPHGNPIPPGNCCNNFTTAVRHAVAPLKAIAIGEMAKVAYIDCRDNRCLFKLNGFQIRPGVEITLRQLAPCVVVECEGSSVALDDTIADSIRVWTSNGNGHVAETEHAPPKRKRSLLRRIGSRLAGR